MFSCNRGQGNFVINSYLQISKTFSKLFLQLLKFFELEMLSNMHVTYGVEAKKILGQFRKKLRSFSFT